MIKRVNSKEQLRNTSEESQAFKSVFFLCVHMENADSEKTGEAELAEHGRSAFQRE